MKRTELRRGGPLRAKAPWRPKRRPLRARSAKTTAFYRTERVPLVRAMLDEHPWCEMGARIVSVEPGYRDCRLRAIGLHEIRKRSQGGSLIDRDNLLRCCGPCNSWVEDQPDLARLAGLVQRRGD